jgi:DNA-binding transcriptional LysR family regulator
VELADRPVDLVHDRIDVAIRFAQDVAPQLIARKLAPVGLVVCAAPSYLARRGTPQTPLDLAGHETLGYTYHSLGDTWKFIDPSGAEVLVRTRSNVHANNGDVLRELALAGCGILALPTFLIEEDIAAGRLVTLFDDWSLGEFHLFAVYLSRKFLPAKVRVFIDFIVEVVRDLRARREKASSARP